MRVKCVTAIQYHGFQPASHLGPDISELGPRRCRDHCRHGAALEILQAGVMGLARLDIGFARSR